MTNRSITLLIWMLFVGLALSAGGLCPHAHSAQPLSTTEEWALHQIEEGKDIDFDQHCPKILLSQDPGDINAPCRSVSGDFVERIIRQNNVSNFHWPRSRIAIRHANVIGPTDLTGSQINGLFDFEESTFEDDFILNDTKISNSVTFKYDNFLGNFELRTINVGGKLRLEHSYLGGEFNFEHAQIGSDAKFIDDTFVQKVDGHAANINGFFYLIDVSFEVLIQLGNVHVSKTLRLTSQNADGPFYIDDAYIEGNLWIEGTYKNNGFDQCEWYSCRRQNWD
jgi:hypothetical protein